VSDRVLYSRKEAATYIGVSLSTLDVILSRGLVRARRIGRRVLIHQAELDRFVRADHTEIWPKKRNKKTYRPKSLGTRKSRVPSPSSTDGSSLNRSEAI
jgi:excisionase family DNA binding protein